MKPVGLFLLGFAFCGSATLAQTKVMAVPSFFNPSSSKIGDTDVVFECFDKSHKKLVAESIEDFGNVWYVSKLKNYIDYNKKYKDVDGIEKPLPVSVIVYRYDRVSKSSWMSVNYANNKMATLIEQKDQIIRNEKIKSKDGVEIDVRYYQCIEEQD